MGFPKIGGTFLGFCRMRIMVYSGLYWGPHPLRGFTIFSIQDRRNRESVLLGKREPAVLAAAHVEVSFRDAFPSLNLSKLRVQGLGGMISCQVWGVGAPREITLLQATNVALQRLHPGKEDQAIFHACL